MNPKYTSDEYLFYKLTDFVLNQMNPYVSNNNNYIIEFNLAKRCQHLEF